MPSVEPRASPSGPVWQVSTNILPLAIMVLRRSISAVLNIFFIISTYFVAAHAFTHDQSNKLKPFSRGFFFTISNISINRRIKAAQAITMNCSLYSE